MKYMLLIHQETPQRHASLRTGRNFTEDEQKGG